MATAHEHDDFLDEPPPPAYELSNAELDRKIADATQRSLVLQEQQLHRPNLPPLDNDGFPAWSDELFKYNETMRQREEEARSTKLQSEYTRPSVPAAASGSSSTSPPPHIQPLSGSFNSKQKGGQFGWLDGSGGISQDDDIQHTGLNVGRPPSMSYSPPRMQNQSHPRPGIQVQVGRRPHDVLAQPQSPVSDVDEDEPLSSAAPVPNLARAPTYYPVGQSHPGHEQQLRRSTTRCSVDSTRSELPAWTAVAPSLEGPAYEEVEGSGPRQGHSHIQGLGRVASSAVHGPGRRSTSPEQRRQTQGDWQPRPQVQEARRAATAAPYAPGGVPYAAPSPPPQPRVPSVGVPLRGPSPAPPVPAQVPLSTSPSSYTASAYTPSQGAYIPAAAAPPPTHGLFGYTPGGVSGGFDPIIAYRSTQRYTLAGRVDSASTEGIYEAQKALREGGAGAFYNHAVAATMQKNTVFQAPAPPPQRPDDDRASVYSGMSGGRQSVYSGGPAGRMSVYSGHSGDNRMGFVPGGNGPASFVPPPPPPGARPPFAQPGPQIGGYTPGAQGGYVPGGHVPNGQASRPLPTEPGFAPPQPNGGGFIHPPPNAGGFVAPPPPPGAIGPGGFVHPGKKPNKLYKRL